MKKIYFFLALVLLTGYTANSQPNDLCTGAITINCGQTISATTVGATIDAVGTCNFVNLGTAPGVWYTMTGDGQNNTLSLCGSSFDTEVGVFTGTCGGLVCLTANDDFCGLQSEVSFPTTLGVTYYILVTGFGVNTGSFTITRTCLAPLPNDLCTGAININCAQTVTGTTAGSSPDAVGTCNFVNLATAPGVWYTMTGDGLSNTLSLCGSSFDTEVGVFTGTCAGLVCVTANDDFCGLQSQVSFTATLGTTYYILVTGFGAGAGNFSMTRTCAAPNPNDLCTGAINIDCAQTITGNTSSATIDNVPTCGTTLNTAPGLWYTFTGNGATITLSTCGSGYDTKIGVFSGTCASLVCVTGNDDFCGLQSQVSFPSVFGTQYYVLITGFASGAGSFTLTRTCVFPNELCTGAIPINCGQTINGTTVGAAIDAVGTCATPLNTAPGVWYSFVGDGSSVTLSTCGGISNYDTKLGVFTGTCAGLVCVTGNDDFCGVQSTVTFGTVFGNTYYILVTGFSTNTGNYSLTRTCVPPCTGTPTAGTITGTAAVCASATGTLTLSGFTGLPGISVQWKSSTTAGGPYTNIPGAIGSSYNYTATPTTTYYIVTVSCAGGGSANTPEFALTRSLPVHSAVSATVTTICSPGSATVTGTVSGGVLSGSGIYTHTLTGGPGTITQNPPTGAGNSTANFTVTNIPFGTYTYTLTSTDPIGCSVSTNVTVLIKQTPTITFIQNPVNPICNGTVQMITAVVAPSLPQTFSQGATTQVPGGQPTNSTGPADPYSSNVVVSGLPTSGVTVKSVKLGNINHTFPDDIDVVLVSPAGTSVILMSDACGGTDAVGADYVLDDAAASLLDDNNLSPSGTYRPTNYGTPDAFIAPGPGSISQATPTISSFGTGNHNGTWRLYVVDDAGGDLGYIGNWSITFNIPSTVVFSPTTSLYTDAAATIPYTGTPVSVVYAKPSTTANYTVNTTVDGCTGSNTVTVVVNQPPAITTQPLPATQTICAGFNVTYTVAATGTGLTYQWRKDGVNLVDNAQISGSTTNTLNITAVTTANNGSYTVVVSGSCPPPATSNAAVLNIATTPVISTQPANQTRCVGQNAVFTVANVGSVPLPTIFQWQVSTDGGATWTNLTTGGSFTNTLTVSNVQTTDNNKRYRVIVTNSCGQTITSAAAILTVVANPTVTAAVLPRICISDTLVPLVGTPVGGSWSGIGVSGFNFVPGATAVGTYTLTYTYTNAAGCTATATSIAKVEDCPERMRLLRDNAAIIYPNPNTGRFNIKMNSTLYSYLGMRVYTTDGQLVTIQSWGGLVYGRVIPVNLTHLPAATYMVKLYFDDGVRTAEKTFQVVIAGH